jgi:hypothetical protein
LPTNNKSSMVQVINCLLVIAGWAGTILYRDICCIYFLLEFVWPQIF